MIDNVTITYQYMANNSANVKLYAVGDGMEFSGIFKNVDVDILRGFRARAEAAFKRMRQKSDDAKVTAVSHG